MPAFPYKLHELLETTTSDEELSSVISWLPDGMSFRIHSAEEFEKKVLKEYFPRQTHVKSFKRQLQYYDFENFGDGLFSHPCFRRGQRNLCGRVIHQLPTKSQKEGGGAARRPQKARGRKKKSRSASLVSTGSSSGSLKSRILKAAAAGDASVVSLGSESSVPGASPKSNHAHQTNIPKFVGGQQALALVSQMGNSMVPMPVLSAQMISQQQQHIVQQKQFARLQQMQAMQMARQRYLSCLQQEAMLQAMMQKNSILAASLAGQELLIKQHQHGVPQKAPSSSSKVDAPQV